MTDQTAETRADPLEELRAEIVARHVRDREGPAYCKWDRTLWPCDVARLLAVEGLTLVLPADFTVGEVKEVIDHIRSKRAALTPGAPDHE